MNNMHNENSPSRQDNRYDTLESLRNWELENQDQDIRGPPLIDERGTKLGVIHDLLVDKVGERVVAVRLDNCTAYG